MTWHLKDESLEKKLIELCPEFIDNLQVAVERKIPGDDGVCVGFLRHDRGKPYGNELWFWISELVKVKEYDPDEWNEYPEIKPPEGEYLRVVVEHRSELVRLVGKKDPYSDRLLVAIGDGRFFARPEKHFDCTKILFRAWI